MLLRLCVPTALFLLAACAPRVEREEAPGGIDSSVFYGRVDPRRASYELTANEDFRLGALRADDRVLPIYPERWLRAAPAQVIVCAEVHIDERGTVFGTEAVRDIARCPPIPPEVEPDFRAAVDAALRQWTFEPSYRCSLRDDAPADGSCDGAATRQAVPVSLAYRFEFVRTATGASVGSSGLR